MANSNLSLSISTGVDGFNLSDITVGTSAPGTGTFEFRVASTDANGNTPTRKQMIIALDAFKRALLSGGVVTTNLGF